MMRDFGSFLEEYSPGNPVSGGGYICILGIGGLSGSHQLLPVQSGLFCIVQGRWFQETVGAPPHKARHYLHQARSEQ
jgi:hypothetical protein